MNLHERVRSMNRSRKLSWSQVEAIRRSWEAGAKQEALAKQHGITQSHVSRIVNGSRRRAEV